MIAFDINVAVYAFRREAPRHSEFSRWLQAVVDADEAFGVSGLVLSAFLRIVTSPRVFPTPASLAEAIGFADALRSAPNAVALAPGERHWAIFTRLCREVEAKGNLVPDAYMAALAIESGCEWVTTDRDFARFPGLRWRHPLD